MLYEEPLTFGLLLQVEEKLNALINHQVLADVRAQLPRHCTELLTTLMLGALCALAMLTTQLGFHMSVLIPLEIWVEWLPTKSPACICICMYQ